MRTVLVTGASGFLGFHLLREASVDSSLKIRALYHSAKPQWSETLNAQNVEWFHSSQAQSLVRQEDIDSVIHLATVYDSATTEEMEAVNIEWPLSILEALKSREGTLFVNIDSYFCKADAGYAYLPNYIHCKRSLFKQLEKIAADEAGRIKIVNARLEHVYGEMDSDRKMVPAILKSLKRGEKIQATEGRQRRDFIYARDVATALLAVITREAKYFDNDFSEYEIGSGKSIELREFLESLAREVGSPKENIEFGALPYRQAELMDSFANPKFVKDFGWTPKFTVAAGIRAMNNF